MEDCELNVVLGKPCKCGYGGECSSNESAIVCVENGPLPMCVPVITNGPIVFSACSTSLEVGSIVTVVTDSLRKNGVPELLLQCSETEDCVKSTTNTDV